MGSGRKDIGGNRNETSWTRPTKDVQVGTGSNRDQGRAIKLRVAECHGCDRARGLRRSRRAVVVNQREPERAPDQQIRLSITIKIGGKNADRCAARSM